MEVKQKSFVMNHVICVKEVVDSPGEFSRVAMMLRAAVIEKGLYPTGPIVCQQELQADGKYEYAMYVPINQPVNIGGNGTLSYLPKLEIRDGLGIRCLSGEKEQRAAERALEEYAREHALKLAKPFYQICMNVYGGTVLDLFAPIVGEKENDI